MIASTLLIGIAISAGLCQTIVAAVGGAWALRRVRAPERPDAQEGIAAVNVVRTTVVIGGTALAVVGLASAFGRWTNPTVLIAILATMGVHLVCVAFAAWLAEPYEAILWDE